jgi:hypothetical protein
LIHALEGLRLLAPNLSGIVRGPDSYALEGGAFGAGRTKRVQEGGRIVQKRYGHKGIDFVFPAGAPVACPCASTFIASGLAYEGDSRFRTMHLRVADFPGLVLKLLYCDPLLLSTPQEFSTGQEIARAQDLALRYGDPDGAGKGKEIVNHVHLELRLRGEAIDPTEYVYYQEAA